MNLSKETRTAAREVIDAVQAATGNGFLTVPLCAGHREFMVALLNAFGVDGATVAPKATDNELVVMYATARGNLFAGSQVATRIGVKYGAPNPLLDVRPLATPTPPAPAPSPAPTPAPSPDMGQYAAKGDLIRLERSLDDVREGFGAVEKRARQYAKDVAQTEAGELRRNLTDTLKAVTDALPEAVKGHVADALKAIMPTTLHVVLPNSAPTPLGVVHRETGKIIRMLAAGVNVYLHGPAGSGKTTVGRKAAEAFDLPFYFAAKVESEYMLLGFKGATGETVRTQFREAYEHGGVFLFDELDGSSPAAVVALNAALANGICPFPDGIITRHANFKCIGAGNTKLGGASRQYVGRAQLDAASVDRFAFVEFGYDDSLETALATNAPWCAYVQDARRAVGERGLTHLITPRATYDGCKLLEAGLTAAEVASAVVWKGLDTETVAQIQRSMRVALPTDAEIL